MRKIEKIESPSKRVRKGDLTLKEMLKLSKVYYSKNDNKSWRAGLDVTSAKIYLRKNLEYNFSNKLWEQTGREVRIDFLIRTVPKSYIDNSGEKVHRYPVTFLIRDFEAGMDSSFRCRVGGLKKPIMTKKIKKAMSESQKKSIRDFNKKVASTNIKNGVQLQFFFESMWVYKKNGLLWGPNYAGWSPIKTNKKKALFFSKHEYFLVTKALPRLFNNDKLKMFVNKKS